jgi:hypothetical protein
MGGFYMANASGLTVESPIIYFVILVAISFIVGLMILLKRMTQKGRTFSKILFPSVIILVMGICGFVIGIITNSNIALKIIFVFSFILCGLIASITNYLWNNRR